MSLSINKIIGEKFDNLWLKPRFPKNESKETMIEWGEKLRNVKGKSTCCEIFNPFYTNEISKGNTNIKGGLKLESSKLALIDEVVQYHMKLEFVTNNFLNKFSQCVE